MELRERLAYAFSALTDNHVVEVINGHIPVDRDAGPAFKALRELVRPYANGVQPPPSAEQGLQVIQQILDDPVAQPELTAKLGPLGLRAISMVLGSAFTALQRPSHGAEPDFGAASGGRLVRAAPAMYPSGMRVMNNTGGIVNLDEMMARTGTAAPPPAPPPAPSGPPPTVHVPQALPAVPNPAQWGGASAYPPAPGPAPWAQPAQPPPPAPPYAPPPAPPYAAAPWTGFPPPPPPAPPPASPAPAPGVGFPLPPAPGAPSAAAPVPLPVPVAEPIPPSVAVPVAPPTPVAPPAPATPWEAHRMGVADYTYAVVTALIHLLRFGQLHKAWGKAEWESNNYGLEWGWVRLTTTREVEALLLRLPQEKVPDSIYGALSGGCRSLHRLAGIGTVKEILGTLGEYPELARTLQLEHYSRLYAAAEDLARDLNQVSPAAYLVFANTLRLGGALAVRRATLPTPEIPKVFPWAVWAKAQETVLQEAGVSIKTLEPLHQIAVHNPLLDLDRYPAVLVDDQGIEHTIPAKAIFSPSAVLDGGKA